MSRPPRARVVRRPHTRDFLCGTHLPLFEVELEDDGVGWVQPFIIVWHHLVRHEPKPLVEGYGVVVVGLHVKVRVHDEGVGASLVERVL